MQRNPLWLNMRQQVQRGEAEQQNKRLSILINSTSAPHKSKTVSGSLLFSSLWLVNAGVRVSDRVQDVC